MASHGAEQVGIEHLDPARDVGLLGRPEPHDRGVVHEHIDVAGGLKQTTDGLVVGDIHLRDPNLAAGSSSKVEELLTVAFGSAHRRYDIESVCPKAKRGREPDPR
jgi:hypothetical protein